MNSTIILNEEEKEVLDLYGGKIPTISENLVFEKLEEDLGLKIIKDFEEKENNGVVESISLRKH